MSHSEFEVIEQKNGKFFFQFIDEDNVRIFKSKVFESLNDCHKALVKVKAAAEHTTLSTTHIKKSYE